MAARTAPTPGSQIWVTGASRVAPPSRKTAGPPAKQGTKRFGELRRDNPIISHKMLTQQLRKREETGIVACTEFEGYPLRVEYDLTPAGLRLVPLLDALGEWWLSTEMARPAGRPVYVGSADDPI